MRKIIFWIVVLGIVGITFAHQPRLVFTQEIGKLIQVKNPEISQAFYGELRGEEDVYEIKSDKPFLLYVNILAPDIVGSRTDFTVEIVENNYEKYTRLEWWSFMWESFYESFGWDDYLMWPEFERQVIGGTYTIKVSNPDNQWKYSLAVGKIESFPFKEMLNTYKVMPALKMQFFEKPRYSIFWNLVSLWMFIWIIVFVVLVRWGIKIVHHIRHK